MTPLWCYILGAAVGTMVTYTIAHTRSAKTIDQLRLDLAKAKNQIDVMRRLDAHKDNK